MNQPRLPLFTTVCDMHEYMHSHGAPTLGYLDSDGT